MQRTTQEAVSRESVSLAQPRSFREPLSLGPPPDIAAVPEACKRARGWVQPLRLEIGRVLVGQHALVDRLIIALLTGMLPAGIVGDANSTRPLVILFN